MAFVWTEHAPVRRAWRLGSPGRPHRKWLGLCDRSSSIATIGHDVACGAIAMKRTRGYTLVLAVVLTGALGITIGVLGSQFTGTIRETRSSALEICADQLVASGRAWLSLHEGAPRDAGRAIELPVED